MKRPETQYRKKTSNSVFSESHNSDPNGRINPKIAGAGVILAKLPDLHKKLEIRATFFPKKVFLGVFWTFGAVNHFPGEYRPPFPVYPL